MITVRIIKDGQFSWTVYGENAHELPDQLHTYEIGSLTKTYTAALINRAILGGKVYLNASIDAYLPLPEGKHYPTILELLTHTSGYKGYYFETPMIGNFFGGAKQLLRDWPGYGSDQGERPGHGPGRLRL